MKRSYSKIALLVLLGLLIPATYAAEVLFPEIRAKAAKVAKLSSEDFALGKELMGELRKLAAKKRPAVPTPILTYEVLSSAGRMWYTDYNYTDRQLFCSRDLWTGYPSQNQKLCVEKTCELLDLYGGNTFNSYVYYGDRSAVYLKILAERKSNLRMIPTVTPAGYNGPLIPATMKTVGESPYTYRLNGQILYLCWTEVDIPKTRAFIRELEQLTGEPAGLIYSSGTIYTHVDPYLPYAEGKGVPATSLLAWFDQLTAALEICAGVEFSNRLEQDGKLHTQYYYDVIMPLFAAACAQEQFNGKKLCGLQILTGYNNYRGRQRLSANGTKTLRDFLGICKHFNLDILKAFEWDEYNEDSHFQPTVNKPMAYQRILKYWNDRNNNRTFTPNAGDDLSLPNLIVSHRKQIVAGPDYEIEFLHVPDSNKAEKYTALAEIIDETGKVLLKKDMTFNRAELKEYTLHIPAKDFINSETLITRLTIDCQGKKRVIQEGLPFTVVRPTTVNDCTWYSTPLRNILFPKSAQVKFGEAVHPEKALPERIEVPVAADLQFPDPLSSVEIMQNGRDYRYSYDPQNEFRQNDPDRILLCLSFYHLEMLPFGDFEGTMKMENAPSATWFNALPDKNFKYLPDVSVKQTEFSFAEHPQIAKQSATSWRSARMISLKKSEFDKAVFHIDGTYVSGPDKGKSFSWTLPLAKLKAAGVVNHIFENGFQLALEMPQSLDRLPLPVMAADAKFNATLHTGYPNGVLAVRAVSRTGNVWWSAPHVLKRPESKKQTAISVYHNDNGAYDLPVSANRVPHVKYRFTPEYAGNILTTGAGREFYANLGGYDRVPTGYEGYHCSVYSIPYSFRQKPKADETRLVVPKYEKLADGTYCLNFTGKGEFIGFPPSLFPQRAGSTVKFEFMPLDVDRDQVYFVHAEHDIAGFRLRTEDQRLVIDYYRRLAASGDDSAVFKTNLDPVEGKWNTIEFKFDMKTISITLNGKTEKFTTKGIPRWVAVGGFGGDGTISQNKCVQYFKGKLKSFEVIHSAR